MIGICRNCGANLEPGAKRCRRCGAEVTEEPVNEPERKGVFGRDWLSRLADARGSWLFWLVTALGLLLLALILTLALLLLRSKDAPPVAEPPVVTAAPTPSPQPVQPSQPPQVNWAEVYRTFLETDPTVNSRLVANAQDYGFDGTMTAELFALADVTADGVPELLLAPRPEALPGWNVNSQQGQAVERYLVCTIVEGRVSPLMCGKVDFSFYPLALSVNGQWILEQGRSENAGHWMSFRSPEGQSSCRQLRYEIAVEPRTNSAGESCNVPLERWYLDGERVVADKFLELLFPQGAEALNYSPIFFRELSPGCLDTLESDWEARESQRLSRAELYKLRSAAGADWVNRDSGELSCISEPYCISLTSDGETWVMVLGIDQAESWSYVRDIQVEAVNTENGDAWIHETTAGELPEGQVFQYVVGISVPEGSAQPSALHSTIRLSFHDGTEITREYVTQAP
ncbi:MAG: zinc-ribbon domain-containing protein [Candidatus Limivicinus sp.]